jgi:SAM-dependent methyltransferase
MGVPAADCRRIEVIAHLFDLMATNCAQARVLELGCGTAANLIALALEHPQARFIGCDLSRSALDAARRLANSLGLANLELRHNDISVVDDGWGAFDYIVCHDVFSWVGPGVREKVLGILKRNLAPCGVAYVSYDALPGWRLHGIARDMMRYHAAGLSDPHQAVDQARAVLAMAAAAQDRQAGPYAELVREEYFILSRISDAQLYHFAFTDQHQAFYRHEFIRLIREAGLQWVADADATRLFAPREPAAVRAFLDGLPRWDQQQYVDFLNTGRCHAALVCHGDAQIRSRPGEAMLRDCWISRTMAACGDWLSHHPSFGEALAHLEERRPEFVAVRALPRGEESTGAILDAYAAGLIDLGRAPRRLSGRISERPMVSPLVRLQARDAATVTNQMCETVRLSDLARRVVTLLDGARTRTDIVAWVAQEIEEGRAEDDWIVRLRCKEFTAEHLTDHVLRHLRDHALLVA